MDEEKALLDRIREGDENSLNQFVQSELPKVYNLCLRLCHHPQDAEDLCQHVFIKAIRGITKFKGESRLSTWLYRISINTWKNHIRGEARRFSFFHISLFKNDGQDDDKNSEIALPDPTPSPESQMEDKEECRQINKALNKLGPDDRLIVVLRDVEGNSYEEISSLLKTNIGTVKSRLSRAREELRHMRNQMGGTLS